jgi:hypothetical protein
LSTSDGAPVDVIVGGRSRTNFLTSRSRITEQLEREGSSGALSLEFQEVDLEGGVENIVLALQACRADCVVHTAGPFQQRTDPVLLEASIRCSLPYVDVCDEVALCKASKDLHARAVAAKCAAVVAGGIWPGASALMAAEAVAALRKRDGFGDGVSPPEERVDLSFFTAGTGNAGATIVSATFLLLCLPALTYLAGAAVEREPWSDPVGTTPWHH